MLNLITEFMGIAWQQVTDSDIWRYATKTQPDFIKGLNNKSTSDLYNAAASTSLNAPSARLLLHYLGEKTPDFDLHTAIKEGKCILEPDANTLIMLDCAKDGNFTAAAMIHSGRIMEGIPFALKGRYELPYWSVGDQINLRKERAILHAILGKKAEAAYDLTKALELENAQHSSWMKCYHDEESSWRTATLLANILDVDLSNIQLPEDKVSPLISMILEGKSSDVRALFPANFMEKIADYTELCHLPSVRMVCAIAYLAHDKIEAALELFDDVARYGEKERSIRDRVYSYVQAKQDKVYDSVHYMTWVRV